MALIRRVVRLGHTDGRVDARKVGGGVVAVVRVRATTVDGRRGVHRLGLDFSGRRLARHHQVLRGVLLRVGLLVLVVRPRIVHWRFVHVVSVTVSVAMVSTSTAAVGTFARVIVIVTVWTAARRTGTVLGRPFGQVHTTAAANRSRGGRRSLNRVVVVAFQWYRRVLLRNKKKKHVTKTFASLYNINKIKICIHR